MHNHFFIICQDVVDQKLAGRPSVVSHVIVSVVDSAIS